jgi:hypothetical protein
MATIDVSTIQWCAWPAPTVPASDWKAAHWQSCEALRHLRAIEDMHPMGDPEGPLLREWPQWARLVSGRYAFRAAADGRVAIATYEENDGRLACVRLEVSRG